MATADLPEAAVVALRRRLAALRTAERAAGAASPLARIEALAGLDPVAIDLLLIALAPDLGGELANLVAQAARDPSGRPTLACLPALFPDAGARVVGDKLAEHAPLVRLGLVTIDAGADHRPWPARLLRCPDPVIARLTGRAAPFDEQLALDWVAPGRAEADADEAVAALRDRFEPIVLVAPGAIDELRGRARAIATRAAMPVLWTTLAALGERAHLCACLREGLLGPLWMFVDARRTLEEPRLGAVLDVLAGALGPVTLVSESPIRAACAYPIAHVG